MSADTTENVESTSEPVKTSEDVKPPQHGGTIRGGLRRGGFRGNRRKAVPYQKVDDQKRFKSNIFHPPQQQQQQLQQQQHGPTHDNRDSRAMGHQLMHERLFQEKLHEISGPTHELQQLLNKEKLFSCRGRLFIGNLPPDTTEAELSELFKKYGEISELFINKEKHFGFLRLDYRHNAEKAKADLEGRPLRGRMLKIRFSPNGNTIRVKNLDEFVTNELLYLGFSIFGEINRCVAIVDDRGKATGEGFVEFSRKGSAVSAVEKCTERCFYLTSTLRPVIVEMLDTNDETDGHCEKNLKKNQEFYKRRSIGPRFAKPDSFEHEYGMRWKNLHELYSQKIENIKKELSIEQEKLVAQIELARFEHETTMLREQLRAREMDMDRQKKEWEMKEQQADEARRTAEQQMRQQEQDLQARMIQQNEEMRRRQEENKLFMQAQQLDNMLNHQEQAYEQGPPSAEMYDRPRNDNNEGGFSNHFEPQMPQQQQQQQPHNMRSGFGHGGGYGRGSGGNRWINNNRNDFFKRRHF